LTEPNYAGNIIINLASLPDFLRKPILKKRMLEFFSLSHEEKNEIINNALEAGPTIPFPNFSKLFLTWLEVLANISEEERNLMFSYYIKEIIRSPQKLINFYLDGIFEIFMSLDNAKKAILANTIKKIISGLEDENKRKIFLVIPNNAKIQMGL